MQLHSLTLLSSSLLCLLPPLFRILSLLPCLSLSFTSVFEFCCLERTLVADIGERTHCDLSAKHTGTERTERTSAAILCWCQLS